MSQENNFIPNQKKYEAIPPFKMFVKQYFPFIEGTFEALDNYGLLCKVTEYLNKVINDEHIMQDNIEGLYNAFVSLNNYVSNFFDNLDVQEEINNKLDEMTESGYFDNFMTDYLKLIRIYETCEDMLDDYENLVIGMKIKTLGYHAINDGGASEYIITDSEPDTYYEELSNGNYAQMIYSPEINVNQFGAYGDGEHDDTQAIQNCLNYFDYKRRTIYLLDEKTYLISDTLEIPRLVNLSGKSKQNTIIKNTNDLVYAILVTTSWTVIENLSIDSLYGVKFGTITTRIGNTHMNNVYIHNCVTSVFFPASNGYNYFDNCSFMSNGLGKNIIIGNDDNIQSTKINYIYITNCQIDGNANHESDANIGIYVTNFSQYVYIQNCDIVGCYYGLYLNENVFNIFSENNTYCDDKVCIRIYKTSTDAQGLMRNITFTNDAFYSYNSERVCQIMTISNASATIQALHFNNCFCLMATLPEYLIVSQKVNDLITDITSGYNSILGKIQIVGYTYYGKWQEYNSNSFQLQTGNSTSITFGNPKTLLPLKSPCIIFTSGTATLTRNTNADGTWACTVANNSGSYCGGRLI